MNMRKLSINKACVLLGTLLLLAVGAVCTTVYLLTQNIIAVRCVFLFSLFEMCIRDSIITIWAFIHGVTSLATMNNVNYDNDWREKVIDFMDVFQLPFIDNTGEKI